jgi:hypothetical protein
MNDDKLPENAKAVVIAWNALRHIFGPPIPPGWRFVDDRIYVFNPGRDLPVPPGWRLVEAYIGLVDTRPDHSRMPLPRGHVDVVLPSGAALPIGGLVPSDVDVVKAMTPNMTGGVSNWAGIELVFEAARSDYTQQMRAADYAATVKLVEQQQELYLQLARIARDLLTQAGKACDHASGFRHKPETCTTCALLPEGS